MLPDDIYDERSLDEIFERWRSDVQSIDWCSKLGCDLEETSLGLQVTGWKEALKWSRNSRWSRIGEVSSNELFGFVSLQCGVDEWSELAREWSSMLPMVNSTLVPIMGEQIETPVCAQSALKKADVKALLDMSRWLLGRYSWWIFFNWIPGLPDFYFRAFKVFQAGHVPCGWTESVKNYPNGKFYII